MHDEVALAVRPQMDGAVAHMDVAEADAEMHEGAQEFVMVADNVGDVRAALGSRQDTADDVCVGLRPVPFLLEAPAINDVADKVELFARIGLEEGAQGFGLAAARAQVDVGDEDRAIFRPGMGHHVRPIRGFEKAFVTDCLQICDRRSGSRGAVARAVLRLRSG